MHKRAHTFGSQGRGGSAGTRLARKIDKSCATNYVFQRHVADRRKYPAVGGIVAVITQHEDVAIRYLVNSRVVVETVVDAIERLMAHAVQKCFAPALGSVAITDPA